MSTKKNEQTAVVKAQNETVLKNKSIDDTLEELDALALEISPEQETEMKIKAISEIESLAEITKQQLAMRRQRIELEVENKKLDTAKKTIDNIEKIIEAVSSADVLQRVTDNIKTAYDMKMMAEAAERLTNTLRNLMNPNVLDEIGTRKKHKINFMFKSSGAVQGIIQVDASRD